MENKISVKSIDDFLTKRLAQGPEFGVERAKSKSNECGGESVCCVAADTTSLGMRRKDDPDKTSVAGS